MDRDRYDRRQFLIRAAKAGAWAGIACGVGVGFHSTTAPPAHREAAGSVTLPDFSVPGISPRMCMVRGRDRAAALDTALAALGGIAAFIQPGDRVLLKVNAAFASPPLLSATTHPDLVGAMAQRCLAAGAESVTVTDNPINDPASCFMLTGIDAGARRAGARVLIPRDRWFAPTTVPGARLIRDWPVLWEPLKNANKLIGMAPVKDHHRSGASMTIKNWYGLLGGRRNVFHQDIHTIIQELALMVRPTLVILDGITTLMRNGPTGGSLSDLKQTDTLVVGTDPVAADAFGAGLLGRRPADLAYIHMAEAAGAGTADWRSLRPGWI